MNLPTITCTALALVLTSPNAEAQHKYLRGSDCAEALINSIVGDEEPAAFYNTLRDLSDMSQEEFKNAFRSRKSETGGWVAFDAIKLDANWPDSKINRFHKHTKEFLRTDTHSATQTRSYLGYFKSSVEKDAFRAWRECIDTAYKTAQSEAGKLDDLITNGIAFRHDGETLLRIIVRRVSPAISDEPPVLSSEIATTGMTELVEMSNASLEDQIRDWKYATIPNAAMSTWKALHRQAAMTINFEGGRSVDVDIDWSMIGNGPAGDNVNDNRDAVAAELADTSERSTSPDIYNEWITDAQPPAGSLITHVHFDVHVNSNPRPMGALSVQLERADLTAPRPANGLYPKKSTYVGVVESASIGIGKSELNFSGLSSGDVESITYRLLEPLRVEELNELCVVASKSPNDTALSLEIIHATIVVNGKTYVCGMSQEMLALYGGGSSNTYFGETFFGPGWVIRR